MQVSVVISVLHALPTRRSSDLNHRRRDESRQPEASEGDRKRGPSRSHRGPVVAVFPDGAQRAGAIRREPPADLARPRDRKSTRLNSSHLVISYAVFCLKKKTTT